MKPLLLKVDTQPSQSFSVRRDIVPYINNRWHYHNELELVYFEKGHGTQFVGDDIRNFNDGDLVLVGPNIPHYWSFDPEYFDGARNYQADVLVTHFKGDFLGDTFMELPENKPLRTLLHTAKLGIYISGDTRLKTRDLLYDLMSASGTRRIILLIEILNSIANSPNLSTLSSIGFKPQYQEHENERINNIYEFALKNFKRKVALEEVADIAGMSSNAFCRYFKSRTGKTFSQFLIEIRVGHACKLLIDNQLNVKQICYESGFHNFAGFHKYFKRITGRSPLNYQKEYLRS